MPPFTDKAPRKVHFASGTFHGPLSGWPRWQISLNYPYMTTLLAAFGSLVFTKLIFGAQKQASLVPGLIHLQVARYLPSLMVNSSIPADLSSRTVIQQSLWLHAVSLNQF